MFLPFFLFTGLALLVTSEEYSIKLREESSSKITEKDWTPVFIEGYQFLLKNTKSTASLMNVSSEFDVTFKEALRLSNNYDAQDVMFTSMVRAGRFEKKVFSKLFGPPLSQLVGSAWTYWTTLAVITESPSATNNNIISIQDLLLKFEDTIHKTWGKNHSSLGFLLVAKAELANAINAHLSSPSSNRVLSADDDDDYTEITLDEGFKRSAEEIELLQQQLASFDEAKRMQELDTIKQNAAAS